MQDLVFITGNQYKADYLAKWLDREIEHQKVDLDEIQSLDPRAVVEHKVKVAYDVVHRPVLVEDVSLTFMALGHLPGTLVKWFLQELGQEGLCELGNKYADKRATAAITYAFYDGKEIHFFEVAVSGTLAPKPRGESHGWNSLFIPDGYDQTYAEMDDKTFHACSHRGQALERLKAYLEKLDK
ncbi:MAG TPA: non-canonical purine NTP pyrophosphatase [Candidatus Saccharimonadales bacterium]|nr:non-canonical purine NTP pyrophosphatase [Candidatus Saccharimonadales bacterium]